jgi:hypothetical protein
MKTHKFEESIEALFGKCKDTLCAKGREYQNTKVDNSNVFANFERGAEDLDLMREEILWIFFAKHRDSISKFIKDLKKSDVSTVEENLTEPIEGRIMDAINYLFLLNAMIEARKEG